LSPQGVEAEDFRIEASVNANRIGLDDDLQLTVSIYGDSLGRASAPTLPKHEGFRVAGQSQSTSIQWINGRMSATRAIIYRLTPLTEGKHVIDAISVTYQGKEYLTKPIEVEVVEGSVRPPAGGRGAGRASEPFDMFSPPQRQRKPAKQAGEVFVEAALSRPSVYVGEQVILTYRLYTQVPIMGLEVDKQPKLTGFWVEEVKMPKEPDWKEATVGGKTFYVFEIKKSILFPTKPGTATVAPATFSMAIRGSSDPFDSFFFRTTDTVRRRTKPLSLEVRALPAAGRPRDFSGAVGKFKLALELDREEITAGEPLTVDVVLEGQGNLKTVEVPELPTPDDFRTYDPKTEEKFGAGPSGFGGEKRWEFVLVPSSPGRYKLGPLSLSYFDPSQKRYVTTKAGPLTLDVEGATAVPGAPVAAPRSEVKLLRRDVRYLKPAPTELGVAKAPFYRSGFFYATLALPMLLNLGLVAYRWKRESEASQVGLWRRRRARKEAHGRLKQAAKKARHEAKDFYEVTAAALYRYVADKTEVSHSGLTTQQIDSMLEARQVPESARADFLKTIEECEFARFTPGERTRQEMEAFLERAEQAIVSLDKHVE
jgi:hypothetical protein